MAEKRIDWTRLSTLVSVAILVGTEVVGASWAAGWAIGGLMQLPRAYSLVIEIVFALLGFAALAVFIKSALRHEPIKV
ncbi:MAG: hypothetical protein JNK46_09705 [Methylobacteriaceae bacterium]|nr:hypothetical protein [Methylobacteriaceae bacterium]